MAAVFVFTGTAHADVIRVCAPVALMVIKLIVCVDPTGPRLSLQDVREGRSHIVCLEYSSSYVEVVHSLFICRFKTLNQLALPSGADFKPIAAREHYRTVTTDYSRVFSCSHVGVLYLVVMLGNQINKSCVINGCLGTMYRPSINFIEWPQ